MSLSINKAAWFDRPAVIADVGKKVAAAFAQFGRFATRTASRSMRKAGKKKGKYSRPGEPPRYHNRLLRDHIYFAYDSQRKSVVMGPAKLSSRSTISNVPEVLEHGGPSKIRRFRKRWIGRTPIITIHVDAIHVAKRPYMGPAVEKTQQRFKWPQG